MTDFWNALDHVLKHIWLSLGFKMTPDAFEAFEKIRTGLPPEERKTLKHETV